MLSPPVLSFGGHSAQQRHGGRKERPRDEFCGTDDGSARIHDFFARLPQRLCGAPLASATGSRRTDSPTIGGIAFGDRFDPASRVPSFSLMVQIKNLALTGAGLALLCGSAQAQTLFGSSCPGFSGNTPTIGNVGVPIVGSPPWQLTVSGPPGGFGYLAIGFSNTFSSVLGLPLPLDLGLFGPEWTGCDLNVDYSFALQFVLLDGLGNATFNLPGYRSGSVFFQYISIDADLVAFSKIAGVSQGLEMVGNFASGANPGDLVISEIMKDSSFAFDENGEWIEIHNTTANPIDIDGFTLADDGTDTHTINNGGPLFVPAGGYVTLGSNGVCGQNGGVAHDYVYGGTLSFFLANSDDEVVLLDSNSIEIDRVVYDNGITFPDTEGLALSLDPTKLNATDNDVGANWANATCNLGTGCGLIYNTDRGTPGSDNGSCTTPAAPTPTGAVIFVEVMKNPNQALDTEGEWFEVLNTTGSAIDLVGYTFSSGLQTFTVSGSTPVAAGARKLFMRDVLAANNGGIDGVALGAYEYDPTGLLWNMGNDSETLGIYDASNVLVGRLAYNDAAYPDTAGSAMGLDPLAAQTQAAADVGTNWCNQFSTVPGGTDKGTPGAANDMCAVAPSCLGTGTIIVTEIMKDPSFVTDANGEYIELYNTTGAAIDINGWTLKDNGTDSTVINNGGPLLVPAGGFLVLGVNGTFATNGGVTVAYDWGTTTNFTLGNADDEVVLVNGTTVICCVEYLNGGVWPDPAGASMTLDPASFDVLSATSGPNWCVSTTTIAGSTDEGTPGAANDNCP